VFHPVFFFKYLTRKTITIFLRLELIFGFKNRKVTAKKIETSNYALFYAYSLKKKSLALRPIKTNQFLHIRVTDIGNIKHNKYIQFTQKKPENY